MARARAVFGGFILLLIAAPASALQLSPSYSLGELLQPVVAPLEPVTESVGDLLAPITEPTGEILEPVVDPAVEVLSPVTDPLLDPVEEVVDPITDPILDPAEEVVDPITDPIPDPAEEVVDPITDPILDPVEEVVDPITDPILDPVEEVVDPITDPVEDVIDPLVKSDPPPAGGGSPPGGPSAGNGTSDAAGPTPSVGVAGSLTGLPPSPAASLVSSTISLLQPRPPVVLSPSLSQSLLSQILDWLSEVNAGSFLAAPFLGLQVLFRALASAGKGLLVPGVMLAALALVMARDRRIQGTKTP